MRGHFWNSLFRPFGVALLAAAANFLAPEAARAQAFVPPAAPRERVIVINDIAGDPDGLVATAHAFMSPSAEVRAFIGSRGGRGAEEAAVRGRTISDLMGLKIPVFAGSNDRLVNRTTPIPSPGSRAIIDEVNRTGADLKPLYITVGGGLTDVASALLQDPSIAGKFTLVWIGGAEYPNGGHETNQGIDPIAAQVVFNDFNVPIWQVPRDVYFQTQVSLNELKVRMAPYGKIGPWLFQQLTAGVRRPVSGESWTLGDSPLVELTALSAWFSTTNTSAAFDLRPAPILNEDGTYSANPKGRSIRVYKNTNTRYFMEDFFAKLELTYPKQANSGNLARSDPAVAPRRSGAAR